MTTEQPQLPSRRRMLGLIGGLGAAVVVAGCGDDATTSAAPTTTAGNSSATTSTTTAGATSTTAAGAPSTTAAAAVTSCTKIPEETAGPYPGDGTNGPNALTQSGIVRSDIRSSTTTGKVAAGVPLTIKLTIVDSKNGCKTLAGAAVYLWHCDQAGLYSMYSQGVTGENYLRGVQATDSNGVATFTSIFPAAYSGRWPHIHFEIFPSLASATNGQNKTAVSQLALPDDICKAVFATAGYSQSVTNHARTSLTSDNVFSDGVSLQTPTVTGNTAAGYVATLLVAV